MLKGKVFGKCFCSYCGQNSKHYYKWSDSDGEHFIGECFTPGCNNVDYCDNETEESIKQRLARRNWVDLNETINIT